MLEMSFPAGLLKGVEFVSQKEHIDYDQAGQLISETTPGGTMNFTYDAGGNILTKGGDVYTYGNANWPA